SPAGDLPDLGGLTQLRTLDVSRNRLEGQVPSLSALLSLRVLACPGSAREKRGFSGGLQQLFRTEVSGEV
ncbi:unnamed protein product, partial [Scytosiphon promiscuus]